MRLAKEGIVRSTRWAMMRDGGRDHLPDWKQICAELMHDPEEHKALAAALCEFAKHLRKAPATMKDFGASPDILDHAIGRCMAITDSVLAGCK
jgi:serine/threonine-protein kinase HipA